jgi:hypothetical protein
VAAASLQQESNKERRKAGENKKKKKKASNTCCFGCHSFSFKTGTRQGSTSDGRKKEQKKLREKAREDRYTVESKRLHEAASAAHRFKTELLLDVRVLEVLHILHAEDALLLHCLQKRVCYVPLFLVGDTAPSDASDNIEDLL